ncbi:M23 family metallopeptidase [Microlunatus antarcticus]|uniref:Murein DD-endopeptidase MepM/ murein hydrolase activator NlpD n=1 Tax=Microlunatus antarcticus TaxID=53388 RepID=A0A7W5JSX4_9ACTN|nr:murein DD-endopeptidase MepM/ murein hydrolase activator NlpD [Microlunatus antarcticus]
MSTTAALSRLPHRGASEQRTLATNTIVALLIAVVGLLAAGSSSLVTSADEGTARTTRVQPAPVDPVAAGRRSAAVQSALLAEVAAQRGDALAREAQVVVRTSLSAAGTARQQRLTTAQAATQAAAVQIAADRLKAAVAARQAAVDAGLAADPTLADPTLTDPTLSTQATTPVTGTAGTLPAGTTGTLPISTGVVGSKFGEYGHWSRYHTGLDFRAAYGTPIHSVLPGVVVFAGNTGDWAGNHVAVRHADGQTTMYSHMSRMAATTGQTVQAGQVIGYVGQTGRAFGAHLHFELYPVGVKYGDVYKAVDPTPWLQSIGVRTH